jgi:hypothetical protein
MNAVCSLACQPCRRQYCSRQLEGHAYLLAPGILTPGATIWEDRAPVGAEDRRSARFCHSSFNVSIYGKLLFYCFRCEKQSQILDIPLQTNSMLKTQE